MKHKKRQIRRNHDIVVDTSC